MQIDADRAVAAGASWGGFAINYIQGHPEFGFGFKALVCHDGVFDAAYNGYSTDELFFVSYSLHTPMTSSNPRTPVQPRMGRPPVGQAQQGDTRQVQPVAVRRQVVDAAAHHPREQGLSSGRDGQYCGVPCVAAVREVVNGSWNNVADIVHARLGIPSRLVVFPDENHWVLNHGNRCACVCC